MLKRTLPLLSRSAWFFGRWGAVFHGVKKLCTYHHYYHLPLPLLKFMDKKRPTPRFWLDS